MHSPSIMHKNSLVDDYLTALPDPQRKALSALRTRLHALIPGADEAIKTRVPALRYKNTTVVGFGAGKTHLALYVMFGHALDTLADALQDYDATSRVVRYTLENPLPDALIRKIVKLRLAEIDAQQKG